MGAREYYNNLGVLTRVILQVERRSSVLGQLLRTMSAFDAQHQAVATADAANAAAVLVADRAIAALLVVHDDEDEHVEGEQHAADADGDDERQRVAGENVLLENELLVAYDRLVVLRHRVAVGRRRRDHHDRQIQRRVERVVARGRLRDHRRRIRYFERLLRIHDLKQNTELDGQREIRYFGVVISECWRPSGILTASLYD